ncbi:anti-sigma factor [Nocardioides anomalus]|uniref:Regulator of SigK n=1 Tax=Nocardioides anomalus TaxID=2712223 RepID=A0A6G6WLE3_9ACTN|nr:anti-sigma factor [Nocardioides anomalus]QIG46158.1 anti-sigma factor [Nocardioides anomalus]
MSDIHALSGAYAVHALDEDERSEFERHLATCDTCRAEVDSLAETAALFAETTLGTPPASLRERVLADISTVRPLPPALPEQARHRADDRTEGPADEPAATVVALAPRRRRRVASFLAAAAAVAAVGTGIAVTQLNDDAPQDTFSAIAQAPDARTFTTELGNGGSATVVVSKQRNEAYIEAKRMPAAPSGKQYVLWLQHDGTMTQAGVMPEGADSKVKLSGDAATADGAAVSIEDAGTAPTQPSDDVVAAFSFDA